MNHVTIQHSLRQDDDSSEAADVCATTLFLEDKIAMFLTPTSDCL